MPLDYDALVKMEVSSRVMKGRSPEKPTQAISVKIDADLAAYAKAQPWGWLTRTINTGIRAEMNDDPEYMKAKKKYLTRRLKELEREKKKDKAKGGK